MTHTVTKMKPQKAYVDPDSVLDAEDLKAIAEADRDFAEGKTVSLEEVKKMLAKRGVPVGRRVK